MSNYSVFNLYICPRCGKITVISGIDGKCPYCQMSMIKCAETIDNAFIGETKLHINKITAQYYKKSLFEKKLWKSREKQDLNIIKSHNKKVWDENLKKNIKICPQCSIIVTNNYLLETDCCMFCHKPYVDLKTTGFDYYYPELKGEGYILNRLKRQKEKLGIYSNTVLPTNNTKNAGSDTFPLGFIPSLLTLPDKSFEAKERLSGFIGYYIPIIKSFCKRLNENLFDNDLFNEFSYTINHIHNVLRSQRFLGQEFTVNFWTLAFIEIEKSYFLEREQ